MFSARFSPAAPPRQRPLAPPPASAVPVPAFVPTARRSGARVSPRLIGFGGTVPAMPAPTPRRMRHVGFGPGALAGQVRAISARPAAGVAA